MKHKTRGPLPRKPSLTNLGPLSNSDTFGESTFHPDADEIACPTTMGCNAVLHRADAAHSNDPSSRVDVTIAHGQVEREANSSIEADRSSMHAIHDAGGSFLVDWDTLGARRARKTGAWQSMSVALLWKLKENQESRDDFESFLWTLLYNVLRYRPTCVKGPELQSLVHRIFDDVDVSKKGGDRKVQFFDSRQFGYKEIKASKLPIPLRNVLEALRDLFRPLYSTRDREDLSAVDLKALIEAETLTSDSKAIENIFEDNLTPREQWPENDKAEDQLPHAN